jgi:hypothetical protein
MPTSQAKKRIRIDASIVIGRKKHHCTLIIHPRFEGASDTLNARAGAHVQTWILCRKVSGNRGC